MKQTRKLVAIEGFGSGHRAAAYAQRDLESNTNYDDVVVFSFEDAITKPDELADIMHRRRVVGHSAGNMAIRQAMEQFPDSRPESVTMVASPIPTDAAKLILRARAVLSGELRDGAHSANNARLNVYHTLLMGNELRKHARAHFGSIPAISRFDSFEFGNSLVEDDIPTRMVSMTKDEFFPRESLEFYGGFNNRLPELDVLSLEGRHCRFAQKPAQVLGEIAAASLIDYLPPVADNRRFNPSLWPETEPIVA